MGEVRSSRSIALESKRASTNCKEPSSSCAASTPATWARLPRELPALDFWVKALPPGTTNASRFSLSSVTTWQAGSSWRRWRT
ncbi:hypothetical protein E2562_033086 [Oryza meyeriana var. granulata]|uniref:Uncharacterized protein n=1 Tax=Oryza meyeriana var. granulata TaxID=110450 RepID=A0A6G1DRF4_9ORYZ|nr:hypothetical protein E2562_033086 [Oryza meyeriana var. granulata]